MDLSQFFHKQTFKRLFSTRNVVRLLSFNPLRPNNDLSQTSHCNIKGLSVGELVMRIENKITPAKFY